MTTIHDIEKMVLRMVAEGKVDREYLVIKLFDLLQTEGKIEGWWNKDMLMTRDPDVYPMSREYDRLIHPVAVEVKLKKEMRSSITEWTYTVDGELKAIPNQWIRIHGFSLPQILSRLKPRELETVNIKFHLADYNEYRHLDTKEKKNPN